MSNTTIDPKNVSELQIHVYLVKLGKGVFIRGGFPEGEFIRWKNMDEDFIVYGMGSVLGGFLMMIGSQIHALNPKFTKDEIAKILNQYQQRFIKGVADTMNGLEKGHGFVAPSKGGKK